MLDILESKGLYRKKFCCFFGISAGSDQVLADGSYDAVVIAGGYSKEHLPVDSLHEVARVLKKGKLLFCPVVE